MSYTDIQTGLTIWSSSDSYRQIDFSNDIALNWASDSSNSENPMTKFVILNPSEDNLVVTLPKTTLASVGANSVLSNKSGHPVVVKDFSGTTIDTINEASAICLVLSDNSTTAGEWEVFPWGSGSSYITEITVTPPSRGITVTGSPISSGSGEITLGLSDTLASLEQVGEGSLLGFLAKTADGTLALRTITKTDTNLTLQNPAGTADNPIFGLNTSLTNMVSIDVGTLNLSTNTISGSVKLAGNLVSIEDGVTFFNNTKSTRISVNAQTMDDVTYYLPDSRPQLFDGTEYFLTISGNGNDQGSYYIEPSSKRVGASPVAWIVFDGTGDTASLLSSSGNITFVRDGAGTFTFTLSDNMSSVHYGISGTSSNGTINANIIPTITNTNSFSVVTKTDNAINMPYNFISVFGIIE